MARSNNTPQPPLEAILCKYHDIDNERLSLGLLMCNGNKIEPSAWQLLNGNYASKAHQTVFDAITTALAEAEPTTALAIIHRMPPTAGITLEYLQGIEGQGRFAPDGVKNFVMLCSHLSELAKKRRIVEAANSIYELAASQEFDPETALQTAIAQLEAASTTTGGIETMQDAGIQFMNTFNDVLAGVRQGVPTGFPEIDKRGGFTPSDFIVIGADTSIGKTSLAWCIALNAARQGVPIGFVSMEMSNEELFARAVAQSAMVPANRLTIAPIGQQPQLTDDDVQTVNAASMELMQLPIYFEGVRTVEGILTKTRYLAKHKGVKGVFVDYLQILATAGAKDATQFLTDTSRRFQELAKELGIFVCALSQLSRPQQAGNMAVSLTRLRGSQEIAAAADTVIMLTRPEIDGTAYPEPFAEVSTKGTALVSVDKGRKSGTYRFIAAYNAELTKFEPIIGQYPLAANTPLTTTTINDDEYWSNDAF